jgi:3-isopropylmalate/(R)-2-methylmalate dehydratase small subunit
MQEYIKGNALLLGKNIDTDQIYPGRYLELVQPDEIGTHCLEGVDPAIASTFRKGDVIVASTNFGCGSSREHAPIALLAMGASAVVAESFARIFFRNGINLGLPLITCPGISSAVQNGERIEIDIRTGRIVLPGSGKTLQAEQMGDFAMQILSAGGIKPLFRSRKLQQSKD